MLTLDLIVSIILAAAPAITAIIGIIAAVVKLARDGKHNNKEIIDKLNTVSEEVLSAKEYQELKEQLTLAHAENRELKKTINKLLTKIDRITREEKEEE